MANTSSPELLEALESCIDYMEEYGAAVEMGSSIQKARDAILEESRTTAENDVYVLIVGNPFDGLRAIGPFDDPDDIGLDFAPDLFPNDPWWIIKLEKPHNEGV